MKIIIANNNLEERIYILDIIFNEFLGVKYSLEIQDKMKNWEIVLNNSHKLIIEDHFFNNFLQDLDYLNINTIPSDIIFTQNNFIVEKDIPILFGDEYLEIKDREITCGIDIFASSFFMLTRWEEYVDKRRDKHERFSSKSSLASTYNFLHRPIVNEYLEMLWNILQYLGIGEERKKREYQLIPTHDVDVPLRYFSKSKVAREVARDLLKNHNYNDAFKKSKEYIAIKLGVKTDPYDTFEYMIKLEKKAGLKSYFFFMGQGTSPKYDDNYDINNIYIQNLIQVIKQNGHEIVMHPSYFSFNNIKQMGKEKVILEKSFKIKIQYGRQHYLRFEIPTTWQNYEDTAMKWDSTLSYADKEGFRCGVCYEYSVFNILSRKKLNLKEKPLIMMEGSFLTYQKNISAEVMEKKVFELMDSVKKYQGDFVFLWHNSAFFDTWSPYQKVYENICLSSSKELLV